jgi:putative ABC transport system substrate-binding protein
MFAAELVAGKVAVIFAGGSDVAIRAVKAATRIIPIVFRTASDPVASGFVASLSRPGGNVTGITNIGRELIPKRLELLHEMLPSATRVAVLLNPNSGSSQDPVESARIAARQLGLEIIPLPAGTEVEIEAAFTTAARQQASAVLSTDNYLDGRRDQIAALALRHRLVSVANSREGVLAGQLMNYAASNNDMYRQAGVYVGRILKGEKPADLPVQQPTKFELQINLKTAKALGLTVPATVLAAADEVIE